MADLLWLAKALLAMALLFGIGALFVVVFMEASPGLFGAGDCEYLARLRSVHMEGQMAKSSRVKGTLRCADGAVVPIMSTRVMDALRERDRELTRLESVAREDRSRIAILTAQLASLNGSRWVKLGRWLRIVR